MHAYLALVDRKDPATAGKTAHNPEVVRFEQGMRTLVKKMKEPNANVQKIIDEERLSLLSRIQDVFSTRFGIQKLPETFDEQSTRSVQNIVRYLANISLRDAAKETTLSLYLSLLINGQWEAFRRGEDIPLEGYFKSEQQLAAESLMLQRKSANSITPDILGIAPDSLSTFQKILQRDTEIYHLGTTQTIDVKVGTLVRGISELLDSDLYPDPIEKAMLSFMRQRGSAETNKLLAKLFGRLSGKDIKLSDAEERDEKELHVLLENNGLTLSKETIKRVQDKSRAASLAVSIDEFIRGAHVHELLNTLQNTLVPKQDIVSIFNKLGEEFTPTSGAQALSQDVDYLQNLIVKRGAEISEDERVLLKKYLDSITDVMGKLEKIYDDVRERFDKLANGSHLAANELLQKQTAELQKVITSTSLQQEIITVMTGNLNDIVENIRACLSCVTKGQNNDTNLAFGDSIQFLLMSKSKYQKERGSIADEIVYLLPAYRPDGSGEASFVLDQIYGTKSSDMLVGHIQTVFKKFAELKRALPDAQLSVLVTNAAMQSAGISPDTLIARFALVEPKAVIEIVDQVEVTVPQSAMGDRYLEFGSGTPRQSGSRITGGIRISA